MKRTAFTIAAVAFVVTPSDASAIIGAPPEPKLERSRSKKLHPVQAMLEHLLERAPEQVQTYTMRGMMPSAERRELLECGAAEGAD